MYLSQLIVIFVLTIKYPYGIFKRHLREAWRLSSVGRASALQAEGRGFEPLSLHHFYLSAKLPA